MDNKKVVMESLLEFSEDFMWFARTGMMQVRDGRKMMERFPKSALLRDCLSRQDAVGAKRIFNQLFSWDGSLDVVVREYLASYVMDIVDWYFGSKRIFQLSSNLAEMLLETNLPDFLPAETSFVADTFAIKLETPIVLGAEGCLYDFIVCTRDPSVKSLSVHAYPVILSKYKRLERPEKEALLKKAERSDKGFLSRVQRFLSDAAEYGKVQGFTILPQENEGYRETVERIAPAKQLQDFFKVFQLALGTNLYVQTERRDDVETIETVPSKRTDRGQYVTAGAEIFTLVSSYMLHRQSGKEGSGEAGGVRPHFRRGFWRRPKGFGKDPEARATEWVRPTWVHSERIAAGEIPVGSSQQCVSAA